MPADVIIVILYGHGSNVIEKKNNEGATNMDWTHCNFRYATPNLQVSQLKHYI